MSDPTLRNWVVTTLTAFVLLAVVILSFWNPPFITLPGEIQTILLFAALGALGIQTYQSYNAVRAVGK